MRRRGIRVFAVIAVIVGLSIATLSFKEFHLSFFGADVDADGSGPLGLTLGLDLQGGIDLVYQADLPDEVTVTFQEPVEVDQLSALLEDIDQTDAIIATNQFAIRGLSLAEKAQEELRRALDALVSPVEDFEDRDGAVEVAFEVEPDEAALRSALDRLGYSDATFQTPDDKTYTIENLSLEQGAQEELRAALQEFASIDAFDTDDDVLNVTFRVAQDEADLRGALDGLGFTEATIETPGQSRYTIRELSLDETARQDELTNGLQKLAPVEDLKSDINEPNEDQMKGVINTIQRRINALGTTSPIIQTLGDDRVWVQLPGAGGSRIDVAFRSIGAVLTDFATQLRAKGHAQPTVETTGPDSYVIRTEEPLDQEDRDALDALRGTLAPGVSFEFSEEDDSAIDITVPLPPTAETVASQLSGLGFSDLSVQQPSFTVSDFVIRTDEVLPTNDQNRIREALEAGVAEIVDFQVTGGIEEAKDLIGKTAQLVFKERECLVSLEDVQIARELRRPDPCISEELTGGRRWVDKLVGQTVDRPLGLTGADLDRAFPGRDQTTNEHLVHIVWKSRGANIFSDLTTRIAGNDLRRVAIFLDDEQLTVLNVPRPIPGNSGVITGRFTRADTKRLSIQLESGILPVPLVPIREGTVDALLGADSLRKSLVAGLVGLGLVLIFMVVYYRMAGVVAAVSLLTYAAIVLAIFKLIPVTIVLSGIAGLILSIGMAVDANILIFERMKEEMRTGRTLTSAMEAGFRRAWPAIRDGNVSTIITCLILLWFGSRMGTPLITGFALTLLIGVLVSMFTALFVSRNMLQIMAWTPIGKRMDLFTPEPRRLPVGIAGAGTEPGPRGGR